MARQTKAISATTEKSKNERGSPMRAVGHSVDAPNFARKSSFLNSMSSLTTLGRFFLAIPMVAFGAQQIIYLDFVTRVFPKLPSWIPGPVFLACILGAFLIAAGVAIMFKKTARPAALILGAVLLASFLLLYLRLLFANPTNGGLWTNAGKALGLSGGAFLVAGSLPSKSAFQETAGAKIMRALEKFIPLGRYFLASFLILCGILHFVYVEFVASLVPNWIPGHVFWTYFAGVALIAGGAGICIDRTSRLAAVLTGLMIFLWVILLHIPRAAADLRNTNETTAVFEALAFSGVAFLVAVTQKQKD